MICVRRLPNAIPLYQTHHSAQRNTAVLRWYFGGPHRTGAFVGIRGLRAAFGPEREAVSAAGAPARQPLPIRALTGKLSVNPDHCEPSIAGALWVWRLRHERCGGFECPDRTSFRAQKAS